MLRMDNKKALTYLTQQLQITVFQYQLKCRIKLHNH